MSKPLVDKVNSKLSLFKGYSTEAYSNETGKKGLSQDFRLRVLYEPIQRDSPTMLPPTVNPSEIPKTSSLSARAETVNQAPISAMETQSANQLSRLSKLSSQALHTETSNTPLPQMEKEGPSTSLGSMRENTVFISHGHEDKDTIAIPLCEMLLEHGIQAFIQGTDTPNTEEESAIMKAIDSAKIAVIVLSPEFFPRRWPMKTLLRFWEIRDRFPEEHLVVFPFFYRLSVSELREYEEHHFKSLVRFGEIEYPPSKFPACMTANEREPYIDLIKTILRELQYITNVENDLEASNASSDVMHRRRTILLQDLCHKIEQLDKIKKLGGHVTSHEEQEPKDSFRSYFPPVPPTNMRPVIDFDSRDEHGYPTTAEGWVKHHLLGKTNSDPCAVAIRGEAGMGKSTILQALSLDNEIRKHFRHGVHILQLGKDATNVTLFQRLCQILKDSGANKTEQSLRLESEIERGVRYFKTWFNSKDCAFFFDDVCVHRIGVGFLFRLCTIGNIYSRNRVVITTTRHDIASLVSNEKIVHLEPKKPTGQIARWILFSRAQHVRICDYDIYDSRNTG